MLRFEDTELLRFEDESLDGHGTLQVLEHGTRMMVRQPLGLHLGNVGDPTPDEADLVFRDLYCRIDRLHDDGDDHRNESQTDQNVDARRQEEIRALRKCVLKVVDTFDSRRFMSLSI